MDSSIKPVTKKMKRKHYGNRKGRFMRVLLLLFVMAFSVAAVQVSDAGTFKTTVINMKPGNTYDIAKAGNSTQYTVTKSGEYWLKGHSSKAFVRIKGGSRVTLHLMDGLNIDTGAYSYVGDSVPAIWVDDFDGTVKLSLGDDADVKLSGYWGRPGVMKNGLKTKLIFDTDNPDKPGYAEVRSSNNGFFSTPAIGSSEGDGHPTGNIVFEKGHWYAVGRCAATIGASQGNSVDGITFNGGTVEATHLVSEGNMPCGPGIGVTGYGGKADNIVINGGTVRTMGESNSHYPDGGGSINGPGIGASYGGAIGTITINGGRVDAYAGWSVGKHGCSGIGVCCSSDKDRATGDAIIINGGRVRAYAKGGQQGEHLGGIGGSMVGTVKITGGDVYAEGHYDQSGIVGSHVVIEGGKVEAKGGEYHTWSSAGHRGHCIFGNKDIRITGGTIDTTRTDMESLNLFGKNGIYITGGSIDATTTNRTPVNDKGEDLKYTIFHLKNLGGEVVTLKPILNVNVDGLSYEYGCKDVKQDSDGKLFFWLPENTTIRKATADNDNKELFEGKVKAGEQSDHDAKNIYLTQAKEISIRENDESDDIGRAWITMNEKSLSNMQINKRAPLGYKGDGFYFEPEKRIKVADQGGTYLPNVRRGHDELVTNENGEWVNLDVRKNISRLYYNFAPIEYTVKYHSNKPQNASTEIGGTAVPDQAAKFGETYEVSQNTYILPGYTFNTWYRLANGPNYHPGRTFQNMAIFDGTVIDLVAIWKPKTYTVTLDPGTAGGSQKQTGDITFDEALEIPDVPEGWGDEYHSFHCWKDENGNLYDPGDHATNLCTLDSDGNPQGKTLTAVWVEHGKIAVSVTADGQPVSGMENCFKLFNQTGTEYDPVMTYENGIYTFDSAVEAGNAADDQGTAGQAAALEPGDYTLFFDTGTDEYLPMQADIRFAADTTASVIFDYYTVSIGKDPVNSGISSVEIRPPEGMNIPVTNNTVKAPDEAELIIEATVAKGYHFDGYSALGTPPQTKGSASGSFDGSEPKQHIIVKGTAAIMAHAAANVYTVHFDPNAGSGVTGEMEDQDMVYGTAQNLFDNRFKRIGGKFAGWNTKKDGSGDSYDNGDSVENLTSEDGGKVTLYAQWEMKQYSITYDLNGGQLPGDALNPEKYTAADTFTLIDPIRKDHVFRGWIGTGIQHRETKVTIPENSTGDREYYACWSPLRYYVYFKSNGGSYVEPEIIDIHSKAGKPKDPTRSGYIFAGWYADQGLKKPYNFSTEITKDTTLYAKWKIKPTPVLLAKMTTKGKKSLVLSWNKVNGAAGYDIFFSKCRGDDDSLDFKKVKTIKAGKALKWTKKGLKKNKPYRAYVKAYVMKDGKKKYIKTSPQVHTYTAGYTKTYTNAKSVTVKKTSVSLKKGKTYKIKAKVNKLKKRKKLMPAGHTVKLRYLSTDKKIAVVSASGKITAKAKGSCKIYAFAHNGVKKTIKVTVK